MPIVDQDTPKVISIPSATLRKFSGSRVDPYTRYVASILFRDLKISVQGQRNINNCLSNLPLFSSTDPNLSFGWGLSNIIRSPVIHEGSYEHLAMMIALGENFHEPYGARVLMELAKAHASPDDTTPHFSQYRAALHGCNGIFGTSDFGLLVEDYLELNPYPLVWPKGREAIDEVFPPKKLAEAIRALMRVTSGAEAQVTYTGSGIISWFAAISDWLCDLRIAVYDKDGKQLRRPQTGEDPQIILVYVTEASLNVSHQRLPGSMPNVEELSVLDRAYSKSFYPTRFGGRVNWQSLLPRVFGQSFHQLDHDLSKALATFCGSAAKLFEGLAHGVGKDEHGDLVSEENLNNKASYGSGLIETITNWFPELRRFQGRMERSLKLSYEESGKSCGESLGQIRKACDCGICMDKDKVTKENEGLPPAHGYCESIYRSRAPYPDFSVALPSAPG
jgi:hypothetical protein